MSENPQVERRVYSIVKAPRPAQAGAATRRSGLVFKPEPWMKQGACRDAPDPDAWFPDKGEHGARIDEAKRVCREECPVRLLCLSYATASGAQHGIWGGLTAEERNRPDQVRRRRQRHAVAGTDHGDAA
jgi:WhiB family redox-sensing transcriptional regulator